MNFYKKYDNGLRVIAVEIEGALTVSAGIIVKTGSINETAENNGISHFIEHTLFKGTKERSAFDISDGIDRIGAQINAFTSKELTCYYVKSTPEHIFNSMEILSDMFFNATFDKKELDKERGVILEEINMSEDTPEDLCFDILAESYYGDKGLGRPILGKAKLVKSFTREDVLSYMDDYYTADNVVIALAGKVNKDTAEEIVERYFVNSFTRLKGKESVISTPQKPLNLFKSKKIEQSHIAFSLPGVPVNDENSIAFSVANLVLGGGMSSRLFQKIREDMGLAYNVYSYPSQYQSVGNLEIYAGVNTEFRDKASRAIYEEVKNFKKNGITENEFIRGKEQMKSAFIMGQESTTSQMLLYGKYLLFFNECFDFGKRIEEIQALTLDETNRFINDFFDIDMASTATVGPKRTPIKL